MHRGAHQAAGGRALLLVRNSCTHDSRVLRSAGVVAGLDMEPLVVGVVSTEVSERTTTIDGVPVVRLAPRAPYTALLRRLRPAGEAARPRPGEGPAAPEAVGQGSPGGVRAAGRMRLLRRAAVPLHRLLTTLDFYRLAIREVRRRRPDLLHCNDYNTMWVGVYARLTRGTAVVYDSHELWPDRNGRREPRAWLIACEALFVRLAHRTITTSPGYADVLARRYRIPRPALVRNIPAGANVSPADGDAPTDGRRARAVYVGAVTTNRGLEQAIDALAHDPAVTLRIVGPGRRDFRGALAERAERAGVADRLDLAGAVPPDRVVEEIRDADVGLALIQPACLSYSLSLPNKMFEYVRAGLPVVGSELPVIGRFVDEFGLGVTVAPADAPAIARAIASLAEPGRNRAAREAVRHAAAELTWTREREALAAVYRDALARARRAG